MKRIYIFFFALLIISIYAFNASAIEWKTDLDQALKDAKANNKAVFAFFYHYLYYQNPGRQREDFLVWQSPLVKKYLPGYIPVKVDVEGRADIESKYGVISFPTVLFFDPQGRELKSMSIRDKELKKDIVALRLKKAMNSIEQFALVEQQIKINDNNPKLVLMYADGLQERGLFDRAEEQYYRLLHWKDLKPDMAQEVKSSYTNMLFHKGSVDFYMGKYGPCIETMERFIAKNPKSEAMPQAKLLMGMAMYESGSKKEGEKILKQISRDKKAGLLQEQAKRFLTEKKGGSRR